MQTEDLCELQRGQVIGAFQVVSVSHLHYTLDEHVKAYGRHRCSTVGHESMTAHARLSLLKYIYICLYLLNSQL